MKLFVPFDCQKFIEEHPDEFKTYGCGPGGIGDYLVPDTVWGLSIRQACRIHDWAYRHANDASEEARKQHDKILSYNSMRIVIARTTNHTLFVLRRRRVKTYYQMVRAFGGRAYWDENRNKTHEMMDFD
jgi:hypothetical protein